MLSQKHSLEPGDGHLLGIWEGEAKPSSRDCRNSLFREEILNLNHRTPSSLLATGATDGSIVSIKGKNS